ncbi:alpha/beta hydrolase [Gordonia sp. PKS22-38]|uniref:Alpha/beta hydrolase n=1 Tax=Gordonia prachuapensis TaxID=3115651 RepID=A0ABU7MVZ2_9ACTN|nr:alpha/beta hydrolase [Gordonia sp. PKS22-38]
MTTSETHTLDVSGAALTYDIRPAAIGASNRPLFLVGSPMDASGFATLSGYFADRVIVTYDPRAVGRSRRTDDAAEYTPLVHADDIAAVITELDAGPVDMFASSGGAVNALALVGRGDGDLLTTLVAHEPPTAQFLLDRDVILAVCDDMYDTYQVRGLGPAMAKFIALVSRKGELTSSYLVESEPDPAQFGLPTEDDGDRSDPLIGLNIRTCTSYEFDIDALRAASTRVVIGTGVESSGEVAHRGAAALAAAAGLEQVDFPSGHNGFLGGEYGMHGEPEGFAQTLRRILDGE